MSEFKIGRKVRICNDPSRSIRKYSGGKRKRELAGSVQTIWKTRKNQYGVYAVIILNKGSTWTFTLEDVSLVTPETKYPKAELFNPKNLQAN